MIARLRSGRPPPLERAQLRRYRHLRDVTTQPSTELAPIESFQAGLRLKMMHSFPRWAGFSWTAAEFGAALLGTGRLTEEQLRLQADDRGLLGVIHTRIWHRS